MELKDCKKGMKLRKVVSAPDDKVDVGEIAEVTNVRVERTDSPLGLIDQGGHWFTSSPEYYEPAKKEDNRMKKFKRRLAKVFEEMVMTECELEKLENHERATVGQVAQETGFDELGNFKEIVEKFKQFHLQMRKIIVIDGYQAYVDSNGNLNVIVSNAEWNVSKLSHLKQATKSGFPEPVPKETMLKILEWYIEEVK